MGLFAVDYKSVEGQGVYAYGGLRFRADEASLRRYFAEILPHVSLNDLIGEATFWLLLPSTIAAWVLPVLLYYLDISVAIYSTAGIYLVAAVSHFLVYSKPVKNAPSSQRSDNEGGHLGSILSLLGLRPGRPDIREHLSTPLCNALLLATVGSGITKCRMVLRGKAWSRSQGLEDVRSEISVGASGDSEDV